MNWKNNKITHKAEIHNTNNTLIKRIIKHASLVEGLWGQMKFYMMKIFNSNPSHSNIKYFVYESLFRRDIKWINMNERRIFIQDFFKEMNGI
jgi:hypothetical protein